MFNDPAKDRFAEGQVIRSGDMSLILTCHRRRLRLQIDGKEIGATGVAQLDNGPMRVTPISGAIHVIKFGSSD